MTTTRDLVTATQLQFVRVRSALADCECSLSASNEEGNNNVVVDGWPPAVQNSWPQVRRQQHLPDYDIDSAMALTEKNLIDTHCHIDFMFR
jgi:hypothetical protein